MVLGDGLIFYENVPLEVFNISSENTQNKKQHGIKMTYKEKKRVKLQLFETQFKFL